MKEFKFLLKRMPVLNYEKNYQVGICYIGEVEYNGKTTEKGFEGFKISKNVKTVIDQGDFVSQWNISERKVMKMTRLVNVDETNWIIDKYDMLDLVIARTEHDYKSIPKQIEDVLLIEVTDNNKFDDRFLADNF